MSVKGMPQLQARLRAIGDTRSLLRRFAPIGLQEIKIETPRKTSNLSHLNVILSITDNQITYGNRADYAAPVHEGSRPHTIVPHHKKALRFAVGKNRRLSGTPRKGASVIFAKRVRHPGNKANPWMMRGLQKAIRSFGGFKDAVIENWNRAA